MIVLSPTVSRRDFEEGTGWELKPEGACKGEVCVPLPDAVGDEVDVRRMADLIGLPLVSSEKHGVWALGSEMSGGRTLSTAQAPNLELPDRDGNPFALSSLEGEKIVLVAWAPY